MKMNIDKWKKVMKKDTQYISSILILFVSLYVLFSGQVCAATKANKAALDADIAAAKTTGVDAKTATFSAISKGSEQAFNVAKTNNKDFAASAEFLAFDIMVSFGSLDIAGLEPVETFAAAREGIIVGSGLENTAVIGNGIAQAAAKVKETVCLRLGKTLDECPIDYAPALEAYTTPDGKVVGLDAYQNSGQNIRTLIRNLIKAPPAWIKDSNHASRA